MARRRVSKSDDLKKYVEQQIAIAQGDGDFDDGSVDMADVTRKWLEKQGILQVVVDAIKGKTVGGEVLGLKDRVNFALKLSNKMLPDLKATEQKTTIDVNAHIKHTATNDLLIEAGCTTDPIDLVVEPQKEVIDV